MTNVPAHNDAPPATAGKPLDATQQAAFDRWTAKNRAREARNPLHVAPDPSRWKWGWSRYVGAHYGPIPVGFLMVCGLIVVRVLLR